MEYNEEGETSKMNQEIVDRILGNPEEEIPKVAKEFYPDDKKAQEDFTKEIEYTISILSGYKGDE